MENHRLEHLLAEVHRELAGADRLDPDARDLAERVVAELNRIDETSAAEGTLAGNVRDLILKVESEYPKLAVALGQVADALARLGI